MKAKLLKIAHLRRRTRYFLHYPRSNHPSTVSAIRGKKWKSEKKEKKYLSLLNKNKFEFIKSRIEVICNYVNSSDWTSNLNSFLWDELPRIEVNCSRFFLIPNHVAHNIKKLERAFSIYFSYRGNMSTSNQLICLHLNTVWYQIIIELN